MAQLKIRHSKEKFYDKKKLLMELVMLIFILIMIAISIYAYATLPNVVPVHWNASGQADNYGNKWIAAFLIPIIYIIFSILAFILPAMDVFKDNIKKFYNYYYLMKIVFSVFFITLYIATLMPNYGYVFNMSYLIMIAIAILFFAIGYILRHVKRNFFIGIRTPWTLADDEVWDDTHRIGGVMFMAVSVILLIGLVFLKIEYILYIFIGLLLLMVIFLMLYSYFLYRKKYHSRK